MADAGADAIIAHMGTTVGGSIGVTGANCTRQEASERTIEIIEAGKKAKTNLFFLTHISTVRSLVVLSTHRKMPGSYSIKQAPMASLVHHR
ncbi:MAG: hypothetical protein QM802_02725 [Agriterribacter sp.]